MIVSLLASAAVIAAAPLPCTRAMGVDPCRVFGTQADKPSPRSEHNPNKRNQTKVQS